MRIKRMRKTWGRLNEVFEEIEQSCMDYKLSEAQYYNIYRIFSMEKQNTFTRINLVPPSIRDKQKHFL